MKNVGQPLLKMTQTLTCIIQSRKRFAIDASEKKNFRLDRGCKIKKVIIIRNHDVEVRGG